MAKVVSELVTAPGGSIYVAPVGTAAPADEVTALNVAFIDVGYATEDGVALRRTNDAAVSRAWQSQYDLRKKITGRHAQIAFTLEQWDKVTLPLAFGGGAVSIVTAGHFKYTPPAASSLDDQRAMIIEWQEDFRYRIVVPKLSLATDQMETVLQRTNDAVFPLAFDVLGSDVADAWYILSDDPALSP